MKNIVKVWLVLFLSVVLLVGCGGGGDAGGETHAGVGSGGTGSGKSYAAGVVTRNDNGELVVNDIHFETSTDTTVENANEPGQPLTVFDLKPGMMVEIDATNVEVRDGKQVATAVHIKVISQIQGIVLPSADFPLSGAETLNGAESEAGADNAEAQVEAQAEVQAEAQAVKTQAVAYVLGLPVHLRPETRFDGTLPEGIGSIKPFDVLEVHGFLDAASGQIIATRVTRKDPKTTTEFFVKGMAVDLYDGEQALRIAGVPFVWQDFSLSFKDLQNSIVDIRFQASLLEQLKTPQLPGDPPREELKLAAMVQFNKANFFDSARDVYMDGLVTAFKTEMETGPDGQPRPRIVDQRLFTINNVQVDATGMKTCEVCQTMLPGDRIRIRGLLLEDKVVATSVKRVDDLDAEADPLKP